MAIALDNSATFTFVGGSTSTSYTMTALSGKLLLVTTTFKVTAITYAGVSMTQYVHFDPPISDGNQQQINVYSLTNPASGSNTLALSVAGDGICGIVSYSGVASSQPEAYITASSNNGINNTLVGSLASSVTTLTNNAWSVMFSRGGNNFPRTFTAGTGTLRQSAEFIFGDGCVGIIDSNGPVSPAGSSTLQANWTSGSGFVSNVIVSIAPEPAFTGQMCII